LIKAHQDKIYALARRLAVTQKMRRISFRIHS
jgi:hypothetical protein